MYTYANDMSIKANRAIQASIGCSCGASGIIVSSAPLAAWEFSRISLIANTVRIRCACLVCAKQGFVTMSLDEIGYMRIDEDDIRSLGERCSDFMLIEKRCRHDNDLCLSASLHNDQWSHIYTAAPRVHVVYCANCRKRGPMQLPIGLSDYINEVMNHE